MSSILKALQRVEKDRTPGASPRRALRGDFVAADGARLRRPRGGKQSRMRLWAALGVATLIGAFVWWRLPASSPEGGGPAAPGGEQSAAAVPGRAPALTDKAEPTPAPARAGVAEPTPAPARVRVAGPAPAPAAGAAAPAVAPSSASAGRRARAEAAAARVAEMPTEPTPAAARAAEDIEPGVPADVVAHLPPLGSALESAPVQPTEPAEASAVRAREPASARLSEPAPAPVRGAAQRTEPKAAPAPAAPPATREVAVPTAAPEVAAPTPAPRPAATPVPKVARRAPPPPQVPTVLVERTRWHPSPERRRAWVDVEGMSGVRELGEGEAVGALVVKEIRPSSVVFLHGADTLTRRVGARE